MPYYESAFQLGHWTISGFSLNLTDETVARLRLGPAYNEEGNWHSIRIWDSGRIFLLDEQEMYNSDAFLIKEGGVFGAIQLEPREWSQSFNFKEEHHAGTIRTPENH